MKTDKELLAIAKALSSVSLNHVEESEEVDEVLLKYINKEITYDEAVEIITNLYKRR